MSVRFELMITTPLIEALMDRVPTPHAFNFHRGQRGLDGALVTEIVWPGHGAKRLSAALELSG